MTSRISICVLIPNYNRGEFIAETIESVHAAQENSNYPLSVSILVGDDASTDDSIQVIEKLKTDHPTLSITCYEGKTNTGPNAVINRLIEQMPDDTDLAVVLDSDDCLAPGYFTTTIPALMIAREQEPKIGYVYTDCMLIKADRTLIKLALSDAFNRNKLLTSNYIPQPALITAECLRAGYPYNEIIRTETTQIRCITLAQRGWHGLYIPTTGFYYRMHEKNISGANGKLEGLGPVLLSNLLRTAEVPDELRYETA